MLFDNFIENPSLGKIVASLAIILLGLVLGKFFGSLSRTILNELEANSLIKNKLKSNFNLEGYTYYIISFIVYLLAINLALKQLGITTIVLYIISGIALIAGILVIFFSIKGMLPNLVSGFNLAIYQPFKEKDTISIEEIQGKKFNLEGRIIKIKTTETLILSGQQLIFIPNSVLTRNKVIRL
ncbi:MAG TPA: mechanosensitive ion channel domain-containing protein [Candidatus Nanoarchaeia archaeon]|nr:mechanosensitive ion channel domain-containing protein [Candidatus Nanoarchaeia archaeon]